MESAPEQDRLPSYAERARMHEERRAQALAKARMAMSVGVYRAAADRKLGALRAYTAAARGWLVPAALHQHQHQALWLRLLPRSCSSVRRATRGTRTSAAKG